MAHSTSDYARHSDAELIRASPEDPLAFEVLFERHALMLRQWLRARTGDLVTANDLLAETFAQAWRSAKRFRGQDEDCGAAWLYGIARHLLLAHYRRGRVETAARRRLAMPIDAIYDGDVDAAVARIDAQSLSPSVRAAFAELTDDQQRAIGYRVIEQLSYDEVAARLDCNTATARTRVHRGLQALRGAIAKGAQP